MALRVALVRATCWLWGTAVWEAERECMQDSLGRNIVSCDPSQETIIPRHGASFAEQAKHRTSWSQQARRGG